MNTRETNAVLTRRSTAEEIYPYLNGCCMMDGGAALSPDPLFNVRWDHVSAEDGLQIFVRNPVSLFTKDADSFAWQQTSDGSFEIRVTGNGKLTLDFGTELAAWLEFDCDCPGATLLCGVSEYNDDCMVNVGPKSPFKTGEPVRIGGTYRLNLNDELYEGVRFAFLHVSDFREPFLISFPRAVCQVKPVNYEGSFHSDSALLEKIWYAAAYTVRVNLRADYFSAILMDRGDRFSWTGDAHTAQCASLAVFANYDSVLQNMRYTCRHGNGIETYELYWVESVIDYYRYSADRVGVVSLLPEVYARLDHAYAVFDDIRQLGFVGWDERLGAGFEDPNREENRTLYRMLAIGAWKHFADVLDDLGERESAAVYRAYAAEKTERVMKDPAFLTGLSMHAAADAINADLLSDPAPLYHKDFSDCVQRNSFSPFNQYFLLEAMARAGHHDDALHSILDVYGGQFAYGATTFFEDWRTDWNDFTAENAPVPNNQCGYTSLAHPWSAGVLTWMQEQILGIIPTRPGFETFSVTPHLCGYTDRVWGDMPTPHGKISVYVDVAEGKYLLKVPAGTRGAFGIPKEGLTLTEIKMNGCPIRPSREDKDFAYVDGLTCGEYAIRVVSRGVRISFPAETPMYDASLLGVDETTGGRWRGKYGKNGHIFFGPDEAHDDVVLPSCVVSARHGLDQRIPMERMDPCAVPEGTDPFAQYACATRDNHATLQTFTLDVVLKERRRNTISLYFADDTTNQRELCIEVFDYGTRRLITPITAVRHCAHGVYVSYAYDSSIRFRIDAIRGMNVCLNGVFFD